SPAPRPGAAGSNPAAPPPPDADVRAQPRQMCSPGAWAPCDAHVAFIGPAAVVALLRTAVAAFSGAADAPWRGVNALLRHVTAEWEAQPRHRDPVFARDGWRCAVPACTSRRNLLDHHLLYDHRGAVDQRHHGDNARVC